MDSIVVRSVTQVDAPLILGIVQQSFEEYQGILDPPSGAHRETVDTVRGKIAEGGAFLALIGDEPAGCVVYEPEENALYLGRLAVLPAYRKHGVGRTLVKAVENRARELHQPKVTLGVRVQLPRNRAFFESLGYQVVHYNSHEGHSEPTFMTLEKPL
jgi:predicted N-acetyltransferase YhbS